MNCTTLYVLCETLSAKEETGLAIPLNVRIKRERGKAEKIYTFSRHYYTIDHAD